MDMTQALKFSDMRMANAKEWDAARIETFDKYAEEDAVLAQYAYEIFTEKVEKKEERRAVARARAQRTRKQREALAADSQQQNQQHGDGGFNA